MRSASLLLASSLCVVAAPVAADIRSLAWSEQIAFTIDVDDTIGQRETVVANSEIEGAIVQTTTAGVTASGRFSRRAQAFVKTQPCA